MPAGATSRPNDCTALAELQVLGAIAFDVNETLLDLRALDMPFMALQPQWFSPLRGCRGW